RAGFCVCDALSVAQMGAGPSGQRFGGRETTGLWKRSSEPFRMSPGRSAERERCLVPSKQCLTEAIRDEAVPAPFLNPPWPDPKLLESGLRAIPHVVKSRLGSKK